ncbi:unnamed protein product [Leuciscus chuanchicus]
MRWIKVILNLRSFRTSLSPPLTHRTDTCCLFTSISVCSIISNPSSNQPHGITVCGPSISSDISCFQLHVITVCGPSISSDISCFQLNVITVCGPSISSDISCFQLHVITVCDPSISSDISCFQLHVITVCGPSISRPDNIERYGVVQEQEILKQGIQTPDAPMVGPKKHPTAMQKGPTLYSGNLAEPHLFILPPNTAGEAKLKGRSQTQAISQAPPSHQGLPVIAPALPVSLPFIVPSVQLSTVPGP